MNLHVQLKFKVFAITKKNFKHVNSMKVSQQSSKQKLHAFYFGTTPLTIHAVLLMEWMLG